MATYSFSATEQGTLECSWFYTGTVEADSLEEARQKARENVERGELEAYDSRSGDTVESSLADEDLKVSPVAATHSASVTVTVDAGQLDRVVAVTVSRRLH